MRTMPYASIIRSFELGWLAHVADEGVSVTFFFVCWAVNHLDVAFFGKGKLRVPR
jgi:hypothetical protein